MRWKARSITRSLFGLPILFALIGVSPAQAEVLEEDNLHVRTWNNFALNVYQLHERLIKEKSVRIETHLGGYPNQPDWHYQEQKFFDNADNRLISLIQWDGNVEGQLHTIEVYLRDDQGRVVRDYTAAFLPSYHNAPVQTLISLHHYHQGLHGFRSFDASGYRIVERCQGTYQGKPVELLLDEDEIDDMQYDKDSVMQSDIYEACFGDLPTEAGIYLQPQ
ncbi:MAG: hypothetical protein R6X06_00410 [Gammaproteobacteria bacterium]